MADDLDPKDDPTEDIKQGLTHLWRAARSVGRGVKKEVERTDFGKEVSGAGRELVRAATNVVERIAGEVAGMTSNKPAQPPQHKDAPPTPPPPIPPEDDEFDGVRPKGRIAVDDGEKKDPK